MTTAAARAITLGVAALLLALTACSGLGPKPSPTQPSSTLAAPGSVTSSPTSPTPQASPTATSTPSPEDRPKRDAAAIVERYFVLDSAIRSSSKIPLNRYYEVATGRFAAEVLKFAQQERRKGHRQVGTPNTSVPVAQVITLKGVPKVNVKVCVDVRGVNVVDRQGKSVVDPARANTYLVEMVVVNAKYPSATNWRISDASSRERKCVA